MKLQTKLIAITATCLVGASIFSVSTLAEKDIPSLKALVQTAKDKETAEHNKLDAMPDQTREEKDAKNLQGIKVKSLGLETRRLQLEADPDDTENFAKRLDFAIETTSLCVNEWKASKDFKQAEEVQKRVEKLKKGREEYQKNEKTVKQLRIELDLPVN